MYQHYNCAMCILQYCIGTVVSHGALTIVKLKTNTQQAASFPIVLPKIGVTR